MIIKILLNLSVGLLGAFVLFWIFYYLGGRFLINRIKAAAKRRKEYKKQLGDIRW